MDVDSSDDEISEEDEDCSSLAYEGGSSGSCCKEQKMEIEALRKRLEKVHRRLNIARKSSFCMKVQTVGHKQNSGSYIAKCVSNWLLKCIIILYYQVRPLLKFDHVSVSYRLIEVILFTVFISLSPFFLYSLVVLCLDAYVNLTFTSCKTELSLINHLVLSINNSQKSALAENSSRTATPAANSSPLSPQSNQASQQQETLSGIPSSQKPYNGQLTPLALTFVPQNYANQPSIEPDSTHRTMHSSVDSKVC